MAVTVAFSELEDFLKDKSGELQLNIIDIPVEALDRSYLIGTLGYIIRHHKGILFDLSKTILPECDKLSYTFQGCENLVEAPYIPDSVIYMNACFYYCTSLRKVGNISQSVMNMSATFDSCKMLQYVPDIPNTVTDMAYCFSDCISLLSVSDIPDSVYDLRECFYGCTSLKTVGKIPDTTLFLISRLFYNCTNLEEIKLFKVEELLLPDITVSEEYEVFNNCKSLTSIIVESAMKELNLKRNIEKLGSLFFPTTVDVMSVVKNNGDDIRVPFEKLSSYLWYKRVNKETNPYDINVINFTDVAFKSSLTSGSLGDLISGFNRYVRLLETPDSYNIHPESLEKWFYNVPQLCEISYLPESVKNLQSCFAQTSLKKPPIIPYGVTNMNSCFRMCELLEKTPDIPDSVTNMYECFYNCKTIIYPSNIPNSVKDIESCFNGCSSLRVFPIIPDSITSLNFCFYNCKSLDIAGDIPNSVISMTDCFSGCTSLQSIRNIPDYVTSMGACFAYCINLKTIYKWNLKANILEKNRIFKNCNNLTDIYTDNPYYEIKLEKFLSTVTEFPASLNIKEIVKPTSNKLPFKDLNEYLSLVDSNTKDSPYTINVIDFTEEAFNTSDTSGSLGYIIQDNKKFIFLDEEPESYNIQPVSMSRVFKQVTYLTGISYLPNSIVNMSYCFNGCTSLERVYNIPTSVTDMTGCFLECVNLIEVPTLPETLINMSICFQGCKSLQGIYEIPYGVTNMYSCFRDCSALVDVPLIPKSVINIQGCFYGCNSLINVTLTSRPLIMKECFFGCINLKSVIFISNDTTETKYMDQCFEQCPNLEEIHGFDCLPLESSDTDYEAYVDCNYYALRDTFKGCNKLKKITYVNHNKDLTDQHWDIVKVKFIPNSSGVPESAKVTYFIRNEDSEPETKEITVQLKNRNNIKLTGLTDELVIIDDPEALSEEVSATLNDAIKKMVMNKLELTTNPDVQDPSGENFFLIAKDEKKIKQNIVIVDKDERGEYTGLHFKDNLIHPYMSDSDFDSVFEKI